MSETLEFILSLTLSLLNNSQIIISMLLVILVAACFLGRYIELTKKLVLSSFGILILTILGNVLLNLFFSEMPEGTVMLNFNSGLVLVIFIYAFFFYFFAYKEKKFLRAFESTVCLYLVTAYTSTLSQMTAVYFYGGTDEAMVDLFIDHLGIGGIWTFITIMSFLVTLSLFLVVYFGFYRPKKFYVIGIPYRIFFTVWTALFVTVPFIPAQMSSEYITLEQRYHYIGIFYAIGTLILGLAVPVIMIISSVDRSLREKNKSQEAYLAAELEYIGQYKKKQIETKAFRHDIKNNLAMTQMMLEKGNVEGAKAHIADMLGNVGSLSPKYVTGDEMLDIIIAMKADRMDELNIRFTVDGVADGGLKIKPMDMCSIFANALDNAIEAASKCEDPFVSFTIKRTDRFFVIKIANSASGKIDTNKLLTTSGYTSKKDKDHHGFGLLNVRRAVESLNGIIKADSDGNTFTLSVMMPRADQPR